MKCFSKIFFVIICCLGLGVTAFAEERIRIVSVNDSGENPIIYLKGAQEIEQAEATIGNREAIKVNIEKISEKSIPMNTLVLIDNSLSISEDNREKIKELISEIIAGRQGDEKYAIATFGEKIEILSDFSNNYIELKKIIENIEFVDRETYLTDVLYDLLNGEYLAENDCYTRIFVISDGVDNKTLGYTTEELEEVLSVNKIPIYTIGVYNKKASNNEELKNMFALSRQTNAEYFLLDEVEDYFQIVTELAKDYEIISLEIYPDSQSKDGSKKTVQLKMQIEGETILIQEDDVRIWQATIEQVTIEETGNTETKVEEIKMPEKEGNTTDSVLLSCGIALLVFIAFCIMYFLKKKKQDKEITTISNPYEAKKVESFETELVDVPVKREENGTMLLFDDVNKVKITLTDVNAPAKSFSVYIDRRIVIGRAAIGTDICIDYEPSVSGKHCAIEMRNNRFYLIDLQSSNKTYLNERQVLSEIEINSGNIIKMGRVKMRVEMS